MKDIEQLYSDMLSDFAARTGMEVSTGGDLSARLYAVAAQLYALYAQADWVSRQCFPQTAQGEYLDRHAQLRALERKQASRAEGVVRFFGDENADSQRVIPAGTVCMTAGLVRFETIREGVLAAGEAYVELPVRAVEPGVSGNVRAGSIITLAAAPVGITGCVNNAPLTNGADAEGDEVLRQRILDSFRRLPNGANAAFYEREALAFEGVAAAAALPRNRGVGTVDVVIAALGGLPDQELLDRVQAHFEQCREIAVDVRAVAPEAVKVNVTVRVACQQPDVVFPQVEKAVRGWFLGQRLGHNVLRAQLTSLVFGVDGVENCVVTAPETDLTLTKGQLPVLEMVTVEGME